MKDYDVIIIGSGPAGMTAALYAGRAKLNAVIIEKSMPGGQAATTDEIENYPGFRKISGPDLCMKMYQQMIDFGVEYVAGEVRDFELQGEDRILTVADEQYRTKSIIIATGAEYRLLGVPGELKYRGLGVSYCATCDGAFYRDKEVVVIGGGDAAVEEAQFLTRFAKKVTVIHRRDSLRANKVAQARAEENDKIDWLFNTVVTEVYGEETVQGVSIKDLLTGEERKFPCSGVFIFIGMDPATQFVKHLGITDEHGYVLTNEQMETKVSGVYAVGDVRKKDLRQVVTAIADGAIAAATVGHNLGRFDQCTLKYSK